VSNVTSVEVSWAAKDNVSARDDDDELTSLAEEERHRDRTASEEAASEKDEGSILSCSSIPVDFGDSLPANLTTLVNKRFCLYRLNKPADTELGVLITKKLNRDRRTSGGCLFLTGVWPHLAIFSCKLVSQKLSWHGLLLF
jgi:hypothetical protein